MDKAKPLKKINRVHEAWLLIGLVFLSVMLPFAVQPARADGDQVTTTTSSTATITLSYQVLGGGTPGPPRFHYVINGTAQTVTFSRRGPLIISADEGTAWSVTPNPILTDMDNPSGIGTYRWYSADALNGTASNATLTFTYWHQYPLEIGTNGSGTTTPEADEQWYDAESIVSVTATPTDGWVFSNWTLDGNYAGTDNPISVTMNNLHSLEAIFQTAPPSTTVTMTASYTIVGGGTGYSAPTLKYRQGGIERQYTLTETPAAISADQGSTWSVTPNPLDGSNSSERWYSNQSLNGTATAGTYLFSFYHQYYVTIAYWVASGSGYSAPTFTANKFGTPDPETCAYVPPGIRPFQNDPSLADWFDTGQWTITNILPGSSNTERWTLLSNDSLTIGGTLRTSTNPPTYAFIYHDQYSLAMTAEGGGLVTADNGPNPAAWRLGIKTNFTGTQVLDWQDVNMRVTINATPNDGYAFYGWAGAGAGSYTGTDNSTEVTMTGPVYETATFGGQGGVSVTVNSDPAGTGFVAVDGTPFTTPRTFIWMPGDNHTLTANTPVLGADGHWYVFQSWDGICSQQVLTLLQAQMLQQNQTLQQQDQDCSLPAINYTVPVEQGQSLTITALYQLVQPVNVTVTSDPAGSGYVKVDGTPITTPQTLSWLPGTTHVLTANTPVSGGDGVQYVFQNWGGACLQQAQTLQQQDPDCGLPTINYTVPNAVQQLLQQSTSGLSVQGLSTGLSIGTTFTANYQTQYYLSMKGDEVSPASGWYNSSTSVTISDSNQAFMGWTGVGDGSYTGTDNPAQITMNAPITEIAILTPPRQPGAQYQLTITSAPVNDSGIITIKDLGPITTPLTVNTTDLIGQTHDFAAVPSISCGDGCEYRFDNWTAPSIGTVYSANFTYTVPASNETLTADYAIYYLVTLNVDPPGSGTIYLSFPNGTDVQFITNSTFITWTSPDLSKCDCALHAVPGSGYVFQSWSGGLYGEYTGSLNPVNVTMNGPVSETATFTLEPITEFLLTPIYHHVNVTWAGSADGWDLYWSLTPDMSDKVLLKSLPGIPLVYMTHSPPPSTWNNTVYYQLIPLINGAEQPSVAVVDSTTVLPFPVEEMSVNVLASNTDEIKVRLNYQSVNDGGITTGVQIGEILTSDSTPTPIAIFTTAPVNLPSYHSTGYYIIDYTPTTPLAPGHYQVWFFLWKQLPGENGEFETYMVKVVVTVTVQ